MISEFSKQLESGSHLDDASVAVAVEQLVDERIPVEAKAEFLTQLARKGETLAEIVAFAQELRRRAIQPPIAAETRARGMIDVCGTGGDHAGTFNISTTVAFILAAAGVPVAKHGNRAITSKSGSADVLEVLGIAVELSPERAAESLRQHDFAFFFAPAYHPAFKHIGPARKHCAARGQRTIFNFLGPLLNPARPEAQVIGVPKPELCEPIARALQSLGVRRGLVVCGRVGNQWLDELSTLGENAISEFYHERALSSSRVEQLGFGFQPAQLSDLAGLGRQENAALIRQILAGMERGPKRDMVVLNAGAAFLAAGKSSSILEGMGIATETIDSGRAEAKLTALIGWR